MLIIISIKIIFRKQNKKPTNWLGWAKCSAIKIRPKAVAGSIFGRFSNLEKCRPEVDGGVTSGVSVDKVGMDVHVKFCDFRLNSGRII